MSDVLIDKFFSEKKKEYISTVIFAVMIIAGGCRFGYFVFMAYIEYIFASQYKVNKYIAIGFIIILFCSVLPYFMYGMEIHKMFKSISFCFFVFLPFFLEKKRSIENGVIISACILAAIGIASYFGLLKIEGFVAEYGTKNRLQATFDYPNTFCVLLGYSIWMLLMKYNTGHKIYIPILIFINAIAMLLTFSKFGIASFIVALSLFVFLKFKQQRMTVIMLYGIVYVGIALIFFTNNQGVLLGSTFASRLIYWTDGLKIICRHPFGIGMDNYTKYLFSIQSANYYVFNIHNSYMDLLMNMGVIGFAVYILIIFSGFRHMKKIDPYYAAAGCMVFVHGFFDFDFIYPVLPMLLSLSVSDTFDYKIFIRSKYLYIVKILCALFMCVSMLSYYDSTKKTEDKMSLSSVFASDSNLTYIKELEKKCYIAHDKREWATLRNVGKKIIDCAPYQQLGYNMYAYALNKLYEDTKDNQYSEEYKQLCIIIEQRNADANYFKKYWLDYQEIVLP